MRSGRCPGRTTITLQASTTTTGGNSGCIAPWVVLLRSCLANARRDQSYLWIRRVRPRWLPSAPPTHVRTSQSATTQIASLRVLPILANAGRARWPDEPVWRTCEAARSGAVRRLDPRECIRVDWPDLETAEREE